MVKQACFNNIIKLKNQNYEKRNFDYLTPWLIRLESPNVQIAYGGVEFVQGNQHINTSQINPTLFIGVLCCDMHKM